MPSTPQEEGNRPEADPVGAGCRALLARDGPENRTARKLKLDTESNAEVGWARHALVSGSLVIVQPVEY